MNNVTAYTTDEIQEMISDFTETNLSTPVSFDKIRFYMTEQLINSTGMIGAVKNIAAFMADPLMSMVGMTNLSTIPDDIRSVFTFFSAIPSVTFGGYSDMVIPLRDEKIEPVPTKHISVLGYHKGDKKPSLLVRSGGLIYLVFPDLSVGILNTASITMLDDTDTFQFWSQFEATIVKRFTTLAVKAPTSDDRFDGDVVAIQMAAGPEKAKHFEFGSVVESIRSAKEQPWKKDELTDVPMTMRAVMKFSGNIVDKAIEALKSKAHCFITEDAGTALAAEINMVQAFKHMESIVDKRPLLYTELNNRTEEFMASFDMVKSSAMTINELIGKL